MPKNKPLRENKVVTRAIQEGIREITKRDKAASPERLLKDIDSSRLNDVIVDAYRFIGTRSNDYSGRRGDVYLYNAVERAVASGSVFYASSRKGSLDERSKIMRIAAFIFAALGVLFVAFFGININGDAVSSEISARGNLFGIGFGIFLLILSFMAFSSYKK
ncbi:hypothetical protein HY212_03170 [Candidatus Pacearchaeota archaeon]|nr:hypothetical protein [Candidatus Pacearchaeota archaeon]